MYPPGKPLSLIEFPSDVAHSDAPRLLYDIQYE